MSMSSAVSPIDGHKCYPRGALGAQSTHGLLPRIGDTHTGHLGDTADVQHSQHYAYSRTGTCSRARNRTRKSWLR
jgi:hypothetical protein